MTISPPTIDPDQLEHHRRELTGYCYRMLGSGFEADDAVQETLVRAWKAADTFEGRSSVRSWLYRIATNVCLDMVRSRERRARPMELGPSSPPDESHLGPLLTEKAWVSPIADARILPIDADPADLAAARESITLAFITALQHLPARQRAALILCEVLKWQATEVAELLDTSVAGINSALQRARATLAKLDPDTRVATIGPEEQALLDNYVDAFQRYDVARLVSLLREDATQNMPPFAMWLQGADDIGAWMLGPGYGCLQSILLPTWANGCPAFGQYRVDPEGGHAPWALQVMERLDGGRIAAFTSFLEPDLFPVFGLPTHLPE